MPYAVNVAAITQPGTSLWLSLLLAPVTEGRRLVYNVEQEGSIDNVGIVLECDEERAEAIVQVIRLKFPKPYQLRCYYSKTGNGGWKRV